MTRDHRVNKQPRPTPPDPTQKPYPPPPQPTPSPDAIAPHLRRRPGHLNPRLREQRARRQDEGDVDDRVNGVLHDLRHRSRRGDVVRQATHGDGRPGHALHLSPSAHEPHLGTKKRNGGGRMQGLSRKVFALKTIQGTFTFDNSYPEVRNVARR